MTKRDIISYFNISEEKIVVVYQGCDNSFSETVSQEKKDEIKEKYNLPDKYILYVGSIESRKNLLLTVKALTLLKEKVHLIAIGKQTEYTDVIKGYIKEQNLEGQVSFLSNIPFDELPAIYQMASIFTYPSFFEGFGIPIIEALHSGVPVIAAKGSCLEEAGGPDSVYIDPNDEKGLAKEINNILNDKVKIKLMKEKGYTYVKRFNDKVLANQLIEVYQEIIQQ